MKKLISMVDFIFLQRQREDTDNIRRFWSCERYAKFLKQPLELWMFVPCDEDGSVLEEKHDCDCAGNSEYCSGCKFVDTKYQRAKERCLFAGCIAELNRSNNYYVIKHNDDLIWISWNKSKAIESLIIQELELTPTAQKQIGL